MLYHGYQVHVSQDRPKMQLSPGVPVSDDFRKKVNAWMLEFFGVDNSIRDGVCYLMGQNTILVNPRTYAALQKAVENA